MKFVCISYAQQQSQTVTLGLSSYNYLCVCVCSEFSSEPEVSYSSLKFSTSPTTLHNMTHISWFSV